MTAGTIGASNFAAKLQTFMGTVSPAVGFFPVEVNVGKTPHQILYRVSDPGVPYKDCPCSITPRPFVPVPHIEGTGSPVASHFYIDDIGSNWPAFVNSEQLYNSGGIWTGKAVNKFGSVADEILEEEEAAAPGDGLNVFSKDFTMLQIAVYEVINREKGHDLESAARLSLYGLSPYGLDADIGRSTGGSEIVATAVNLFKSALIYAKHEGNEYTLWASHLFASAAKLFGTVMRTDAAAMSAELASHMIAKLGATNFMSSMGVDEGGDASGHGGTAYHAWQNAIDKLPRDGAFVARLFQALMYVPHSGDCAVYVSELFEKAAAFYSKGDFSLLVAEYHLRTALWDAFGGNWDTVYTGLRSALKIWQTSKPLEGDQMTRLGKFVDAAERLNG